MSDELRAVARDVLRTPVDRKVLADLGWLGIEVPEAFDGADATFLDAAAVLEEMGRAAARAPYLGTAVLGIGTLLSLAPSPARDDLLRAASDGGLGVAAALIDGVDDRLPAAVPFRLERTPGGLVLHGSAELVPDAPDADRLLVLAIDPEGTPVVVVTELAATEQPVLDGTRRFGAVRVDGAPVAEDAVLRFGADPRTAVRHLLDRAGVALACDSLGMSAALLDATVAYVGAREQFGRPVGSFQAVKHACADMHVRVEVSRRLVAAATTAVAAADPSGDGPDAGTAASMAKSYVCAAAVDVAGAALQLHGGMGYTWESGIHVYLKRATLNRTLFGSPAAHRRRLAGRYRQPDKI